MKISLLNWSLEHKVKIKDMWIRLSSTKRKSKPTDFSVSKRQFNAKKGELTGTVKIQDYRESDWKHPLEIFISYSYGSDKIQQMNHPVILQISANQRRVAVRGPFGRKGSWYSGGGMAGTH